MKLAPLLAISSLFLSASLLPARAQTPGTASTLAPRLAEADKKFIKDFVEQHLMEQELVGKARSKEMGAVRDNKPSPLTPAASGLYKKLNNDLTSSWTELATLSQSKKVEITTTPKPADVAVASTMAKLPGDKFDKEFIKTVGKEAKKTDTLLTNAGKSVRDADVKAFIEKWAPTFKTHLAEVESAEKALKAK